MPILKIYPPDASLFLIYTHDITHADPCWYRFGEQLFYSRESAEMTAARYQKFFLRDKLEYRIAECIVELPKDASCPF